MNWTPEMDEILTAHRGLLSSASIGLLLNTNANSVIGRAKRLKLPRLRNTQQYPEGRKTPSQRPPKVVTIKQRPRGEMPPPLNIPYMDLLWFHCREIVGKDDSGLALSCGHRKLEDGPWFCRWHHAVNYTKPQPARARAFPSFGQKQRAA